ncbi:MAG TPA: helix-turn-helix domain-containing protein [Pseudolabrys sp.]|nr:helix-turn-helix domain-containing protein [Pseudolabrys sp.]
MRLRTPLDIGQAIRDNRRRLGLDQDDLAKRVGVSRKWLIDVERGKPGAPIGLLLRTLDALGLRLSLDTAGTSRKRPVKPVSTIDIDRVLDRAKGIRGK